MDKQILERIYTEVSKDIFEVHIQGEIAEKLERICRCERNKAPIRFVMSGLLSKIEDPAIDLHKPYSAMGEHSYKGRVNDEDIIQPFIHKYALPCNQTTAYLTPAFRTIETPLTKQLFINCRPKEVYYDMMDVIEYIEIHPDDSYKALSEIIRLLLVIKAENDERISQLRKALSIDKSSLELSSEEITNLLIQHLKCRGSSRLPVLVIASAYEAVKDLIQEEHKPLYPHNAADSQTGSLGDIEIITKNNDSIVTCYEIKKKRVTTDNVNVCVEKLAKNKNKIDNYIIITTDVIDREVSEYAATIYNEIGIEIVILDCIGFINHFLHFFHRYRTIFLNNYQEMVLSEPESSVSQPLKEAFLNLRRVAEQDRDS
jgi:hypothetical protein